MAHGDFIAIGNLLGETLTNGGKHSAHEAQEHAAHDDKLDILEARCLQNGRQQAGHKHAVMARQEDVLKLGKTGNDNVHDVAENQDHHGLNAEDALSHRNDDLVVGHDAGDVETGLDEGTQRSKVLLNNSSAGRQHDVTKNGLQGSRHHLVGRALERNKAHKGKQTHDPRWLSQNRLDKLKYGKDGLHLRFLSL